ncbi:MULTISPECIES: hypothetical protein [Xanthomonas]|uniref:Uncharacterized protein n=2 Tax=Xanthomonas TaxID=338 RepID=A0AA46C922_9XANT|nr:MULTISPECIES: hypothetical protein [Xanthomonas]CAE1136378.1 hypothetical protein XTG_002211 [Xanthomonas euroxanthea]SUZ28399.1 hypothetical protein CPBF424_22150 [Xanthomonas euroxanthea]
MTVGAAASAIGTTLTHHVDPSLNYTPRQLTRGQRSRQEVFVYQSPRNRRVVTVADPAHFALGLILEFDSAVRAYVERPRQLQLSLKTSVDLSFWSHMANGSQQFHLLIPTARTARSSSGVVMLPAREELIEIGVRNGVLLTCMTELELTSSLARVAVCYELLPLVWDSERIIARAAIAEQVKELLGRAPRLNLASLISALSYTAHQTRATVAWMIHQGILALVDHSPGSSDAVLELAHG